MDQVTRLKARHNLWKDKVFDDFVAALNSMQLESIEVYIHNDVKKYEEYEYEWVYAAGRKQ